MSVSFSKAQAEAVKTVIRLFMVDPDIVGTDAVLTKRQQRSLRIAYGKILDSEQRARDRRHMLDLTPTVDAYGWKPGDPIYRPGT